MREYIAVPIIVLGLTAACSGAGGWSERQSFYSEARCDLSVEQARSLADRLGGSGWSCGSPEPQRDLCGFNVGRTHVSLEFTNSLLKTVEEGQRFGVTGMAMHPKIDVCTGARSRLLAIVPADASWVGASVSVDGQAIGTITTSTWQGLHVPLGRHTLRIEKSGRDAVVKQITVPDGLVRETPEVTVP